MEDLKSKSEQLQALLKDAVDLAATKKIAITAISVVKEQEDAIAAHLGTIAGHEETIENAVDANTALQAKLETIVAGGKVATTVKVAGEAYEVVHGVKTQDGKIYTAKQIAEDADLAAKLVAGNSSALVKVPVDAEEETE